MLWTVDPSGGFSLDNSRSLLSVPHSTTISVAGAPSLLGDDFHGLHLVSSGDPEGEENPRGRRRTRMIGPIAYIQLTQNTSMANTLPFIRWLRLREARPKRNGTSVLGFGPFRTTCAHTVCPRTAPFPPSSRSCPTTATTKLMATSSQGAPGPTGHAGLLRTSVQPVSRSFAVSGSTLTRFEQSSQERLILNEIRKLTVRSLLGALHLRVNQLHDDTRTHSWNSTGYDPVPLTERVSA